MLLQSGIEFESVTQKSLRNSHHGISLSPILHIINLFSCSKFHSNMFHRNELQNSRTPARSVHRSFIQTEFDTRTAEFLSIASAKCEPPHFVNYYYYSMHFISLMHRASCCPASSNRETSPPVHHHHHRIFLHSRLPENSIPFSVRQWAKIQNMHSARHTTTESTTTRFKTHGQNAARERAEKRTANENAAARESAREIIPAEKQSFSIQISEFDRLDAKLCMHINTIFI